MNITCTAYHLTGSPPLPFTLQRSSISPFRSPSPSTCNLTFCSFLSFYLLFPLSISFSLLFFLFRFFLSLNPPPSLSNFLFPFLHCVRPLLTFPLCLFIIHYVTKLHPHAYSSFSEFFHCYSISSIFFSYKDFFTTTIITNNHVYQKYVYLVRIALS